MSQDLTEHQTTFIMSFRFNFPIDEDGETSVNDTEDMNKERVDGVNCISAYTAKEVIPTVAAGILESDFEVLEVCPGVTLNCVRSQSIEERVGSSESDNCISKTAENHSDLIPNVYEGGLKIWECTFDLIGYLHESRVPLAGLSVLELGCGAGLPGIYALQQGAGHVCFQDFNQEVLDHLTVSNVCLNMDKGLERCRFVAGDWSHIGEVLIPSQRYDIVLTSETIYSTDSVPSLYQMMCRTLKPDGKVYVAAKTHYFGVGGGTRLFEDYVHSQGDFSVSICKKFSEGVQREILLMQRKKDSPR